MRPAPARGLWVRVFLLAVCLLGCDPGRLSMGYDDPQPCGAADCRAPTPSLETCLETMGQSRCERAESGECAWRCAFPPNCQDDDCGPPPAEQFMCSNGMTDHYRCQLDDNQRCAWQPPACVP